MTAQPRRLPRAGDIPGKPTGKYQARISVTRNGKRQQVALGTYATKREASDRQNNELAKLRVGQGFIDPQDRKRKLDVWAEQWYELRRTPNRKIRSFLDHRIIPTFGSLRLEQITTIEIQRWVNSLTADGLAPSTVRGLYACLKQILTKAVHYELLVKNPCHSIELPKNAERDIVPLSVADMKRLEQHAPDRFKAMIHLACWGGLRWGELAALRWDHFDLGSGTIVVAASMKDDGTIGTTKSGKTRKVMVGPTTVEVLRAHRRDFGTSDLLFTTKRQSRPLSYHNFRVNVWKPLTLACEMDPAPRFHATRHAHATEMVRQGMDMKVLSERLGHHAPSFTLDRYGQVRADATDVTLAALSRAWEASSDINQAGA